MLFPTLKRAHRLKGGDSVRIDDEHGTVFGDVTAIRNSPMTTLITFVNGYTYECPRNKHVQILNNGERNQEESGI